MSAKGSLQEFFQKKRLDAPIYKTIRIGGEPHLPLWQSTVKISYNGIFYFKSGIEHSKAEVEADAANKALDFIKFNKSSNKILAIQPLKKDDEQEFEEENIIYKPKEEIILKPKEIKEEYISYKENIIYKPKEETKENILKPKEERVQIPSNVSSNKNEKTINCVILVDVENQHSGVDDILRALNNKGPFNKNIFIYAFIGDEHQLCNKTWSDKRVHKILVPSTRKNAVDTFMCMNVGAFLLDETFDEYIIVTNDNFGAALAELISSENNIWKSRPAMLTKNIEKIITKLIK